MRAPHILRQVSDVGGKYIRNGKKSLPEHTTIVNILFSCHGHLTLHHRSVTIN